MKDQRAAGNQRHPSSMRRIAPRSPRLARIDQLAPIAAMAAWCTLAVLASTHRVNGGVIEVLLLFGPLVIVPLGLPLTARNPAAAISATRTGTMTAVVAAAIALTSAFVVEGNWSTALTFPWLILTLTLGLWAVQQWRSIVPGERRFDDGVRAVAVCWLGVAAVLITMSRAGMTALGVPPELILLGGVHFDFAGFGATLIGACVLFAVAQPSRRSTWATTATVAVIVGCATVGVGHLTIRPIELVGAHLMAVGVIVLGIVAWPLVPKEQIAGILLRLSALSVVVPMAFALAYSWALTLGIDHLPYETIAMVHGSLNAFGFTFCGLLAWRLHAKA